uniref:Uncharacterized protein n=1 Tax=Anguilla anguilla TaxID=7936 RepID=A0A0E9Q8S0_ANGAN
MLSIYFFWQAFVDEGSPILSVACCVRSRSEDVKKRGGGGAMSSRLLTFLSASHGITLAAGCKIFRGCGTLRQQMW